jgi:uncharacterized protein (UPF0332 family)
VTKDQEALLSKARDSIEAGKLLLDKGYCDFAASRAYYAMFYLAQAALLEQGQSFTKHSAVIAAFGERLAKPGLLPVELHRFILDAYDDRISGDYSTGPGLTSVQVTEQIARAEQFLKGVEQFLRGNRGVSQR